MCVQHKGSCGSNKLIIIYACLFYFWNRGANTKKEKCKRKNFNVKSTQKGQQKIISCDKNLSGGEFISLESTHKSYKKIKCLNFFYYFTSVNMARKWGLEASKIPILWKQFLLIKSWIPLFVLKAPFKDEACFCLHDIIMCK